MSMLTKQTRRASASAVALTLALGAAVVPAHAALAAVVPAPIVHSADDAKLSLEAIGTFETGVFDASAAEIVQAHGDRLFVVNAQAGAVDVLDYSDPSQIVKLYTITSTGVANSVAIREDGLGAIAFQADTKTAAGHVLFFDATAGTATPLGTVTVGALPDNVVFSEDGAFALTANEGEPADDFSSDPEGSVSVIGLPGELAAPAQSDVRTADFNDFEAGGSKTLPAGVRVFGPTPHGADKPVSRNLEPEYITVDGDTAYVALQEANAIAKVDIAQAEITEVLDLGRKDHGAAGNGIDPSDQGTTVDIRTFEGLKGIYMPDGIASYQAGGETYLVTANEGDAREWGSYVEGARAGSLTLCADSPLVGKLGNTDLGRLNVSKEEGLNAAGTCYEELHAFGARSFSIWGADGTQVFDSGDQLERITLAANPDYFNSNHTAANRKNRSDDKGPEPENLAIGQIGAGTYAFVGLERVGGVVVYDITDPAESKFVTYVNNRDFTKAANSAAAGDLGAEGLAFIPAADSATGTPLLAVGNEVSGTTTLFEITDLFPELQILTINDFHGRLEAGLSNGEVGAAGVAGAVNAHREQNVNTLFVSAGDNIGASTFPSFIAQDNPSIDVLREAGLDLSAVGNHEFDQGFADLTDRVLPRFGGDEFGLGANVYLKGTQTPALKEFEVKTVDGVRVAFIGTVTEQTAAMVSPTGIAGIEFGDQLAAANRVAGKIVRDDLADAIVLLTHEGSAVSDCSAIAGERSQYGKLVREASTYIDAIVSAHTHQRYACEIAGPSGAERPVIQAHQYGTTLGKLDLVYDRAADKLVSAEGETVSLTRKDGTNNVPVFPSDERIKAIVDSAVEEAAEAGKVQVGEISGDILRGKTSEGSEDRGIESTLGNLVADVYLWATSNDAYAGTKAQIGLMNPGGLRADLAYGADGTVSYRAAANVQPFANTLVTLELTGAQLRQVLEEQWQPEGSSRPKLHLGISDGLSYGYDPEAPRGERVQTIRFEGEDVQDADTFTVVTNSFLAAGGDNFVTLAEGTERTDTGQIDLAATVEYFKSHDTVDPAPLGRAVVGDLEPGVVEPAVSVKAKSSSLKYGQANSATATVTADGRPATGKVQVLFAGKSVKTLELSNGKATIALPKTTRPGSQRLTAKYLGSEGVSAGEASTTVRIAKAKPTVSASLAKKSVKRSQKAKIRVTVKLPGASGVYASGKVRVLSGKKTVKTVSLAASRKGKVTVTLPKLKKGSHKLRVQLPATSTQLTAQSKQLTLRVR
ncbi:choice-of-anchor I family protein [Leucobacter weissii]|uniref:Choice-of-anchor I family protein n=1 Tax=Leucobacter weissii TaxID=1983706 RepID=A0A939MK67_9MICO|nr:choice-of-anchor I family protein [Leucobacter weissii]MBO1902258.1 choice-of-anchor I family protein [Leucobacter weissii]